jgi:hypothetical protein
MDCLERYGEQYSTVAAIDQNDYALIMGYKIREVKMWVDQVCTRYDIDLRHALHPHMLKV